MEVTTFTPKLIPSAFVDGGIHYSPELRINTVTHPNQMKLNWLTDQSMTLTVVFIYSDLSVRSLIKAKKRFERNVRKVYGRKGSNDRLTRLLIHYVPSCTTIESLEDYSRSVIAALTEPSKPSNWFAPAGLDRGIING